jgi:hypothetical protein
MQLRGLAVSGDLGQEDAADNGLSDDLSDDDGVPGDDADADLVTEWLPDLVRHEAGRE